MFIVECKKAALFYCLLILGNSLGNISKRSDIILCLFLVKILGKISSLKSATASTKEHIFS